MKNLCYYNEFDKEKAAWLRELINAGLIAPGDVDERGIEEIDATELVGYTQCHFFAGIGIWSYALRLAGWPDSRPVWTGSCPCPSFSAAGKGAGFDDPRHLWPHWARLIRESKPPVVFGEQVDDAIGFGWLDLVQTDLEAQAYAVGKAVLGACSAGAPHIRQRLYFVAESCRERREWREGSAQGCIADRTDARRIEGHDGVIGAGQTVSGLGLAGGAGLRPSGIDRPGPVNGFWRDADWIRCRDAFWRPVSAKPQPMVDGSAASMGRVCDQIVAEAEEQVNEWANRHQGDPREALHDLQQALSSKALREWASGRFPVLHEAPFLLAFLRQLSEQGWAFSEGVPCKSAEVTQDPMRSVRSHEAATCPSCGRGLDEQRPEQCSDPLHLLSSILARHTQTAWGETYEAYAETGLPLGNKLAARVVRLRGYGDGITAQTAQAFIESVMELGELRPARAIA